MVCGNTCPYGGLLARVPLFIPKGKITNILILKKHSKGKFEHGAECNGGTIAICRGKVGFCAAVGPVE